MWKKVHFVLAGPWKMTSNASSKSIDLWSIYGGVFSKNVVFFPRFQVSSFALSYVVPFFCRCFSSEFVSMSIASCLRQVLPQCTNLHCHCQAKTSNCGWCLCPVIVLDKLATGQTAIGTRNTRRSRVWRWASHGYKHCKHNCIVAKHPKSV